MAKFAVLSILVCFIAFYGQNSAVFASVRTSKLNDGPLLDNGEGHQRRQAVEFGPEGRSPHNVPPGLQPADTGVGAVQRGNGAVPAQIGAVPPNFDGVPHGFEKVLPDEVLEKMRQLHRNRKMPIKRKQIEFDRILSAVPSETLAKIPLPPGFESLPESVQSEIRNIHGNSKLNWTQKTEKVHQLVQSLPPEDRPRLPPGDVPSLPSQRSDFFPQNPPPGFEKVIPAPTYQQLLDIHRNPSLSPHEKSRQIDQIMRSLPQNVVDQLPLPPGFDQLPERELKKARAIFGDRNLSFREKDRKVFEFVKTLSPHLRRFVRPPLPPVFARLRSDTQSKIGDLLDDDSLDDSQRQKRFWELANGLADDEKATLGEVLKFAPA